MDTSDWEFPDVCRYYFGKFGQWSSLVFSMVSLIGAMVVYWVLMSNFLYNTGQFIYSESHLILSVPFSLMLDVRAPAHRLQWFHTERCKLVIAPFKV